MKNREKNNKEPIKPWKISTISTVFIFFKIYFFEEKFARKKVQIPVIIKKKRRFVDLGEFVRKVKSGNVDDGDIKILEKLFQKLYKLHKKNKKRVVAFCFSSVVVAVGVGLITSLIFPTIFKSNAASYTWTQSSWAGGATANYPTHETNQSGWTEYSAADSNITAGANISVSTTSSSSAQTNDTQFNAGTLSDTQVVGSSSSASVFLDITSALDWGENGYVSTYDTTGNSYGVFVSGNYLYIADYASGLQIVDITDPENPTLTGTYDTPGYAYEIYVTGNYAYVADYTYGLQIIDISTPSNPTLAGTYNTPGMAEDVYVSGNYAYVADYNGGLQIIDITDPANPSLTDDYDTPGYAYGVYISGNYAYVADGSSGLQIIDITDPANPSLTGSYDTDGSSRKIYLDGNYAYIADSSSGGLKIINITDPANPSLTGSYDTIGYARDVYFLNNRIYISDGLYGFAVMNVSDPANPTIMGVYDTPDNAFGIFVSGGNCFIADDDSGVHIVDITTPANVSLKGTYNTPGQANDVVVEGNYAYVPDENSGLHILDISTPSNPTLTGTYDTAGNARDVFILGNYAYVADFASGLQIIDISTPASPTLTGTYDTPGWAYAVYVVGNYAYVADYGSGLQIIDISTPASPTLTGTYDTPGYAYEVLVVGNYAYVPDSGSGLQIIDISTPASPTLTGTYDTTGSAYDVYIIGDYAYVADSGSGLQIIDISTPASPSLVGTYDTVGSSYGVYVLGNYAYIADGSAGFQIIDITDPANLSLVAIYQTSYTTYGVYASGAYGYFTDGSGGLNILSTGSYLSSGTYTSSAIDTGQNNQAWGNVSWDTTVPASTQMVLMAKTSLSDSIDNVDSCDQLVVITSANQSGSVALSGNNCITAGERYIKYYLEFSSSNSDYSPALNDLTINFTYYPTEQTITSSAYNASTVVSVIGSLEWSETLPSGTDIKFQIRTATDSSGSPGTWTDWLGPTGTGDYYTDPSGLETINSTHSDGVNDDWFQYKAWLATNNVNAPTLDDIVFNYAANVAPTIQNVTASQNANGTVTISYEVRDTDTTTGTTTPNAVTPSFEYWNGAAYVSCTTMAAGDTDNKAVLEGSFSSYTATWTAATDFSGNFMNNTAKIRVTVDDNELASSSTSAESATYTLDTKAPAQTEFSVDATTSPPTLTLTAADDSSFEMKISLLSDLSDASWVSYQETSNITLATNPDTVYAQLKDAFSNETSILNTTIPLSPQNIIIRDVTNLDTSDYQLFIAWEESALGVSDFKQYNVYKSDDGTTYALAATLTDETINYYMSQSLSEGTTYYYKVTTEDNDNNISPYSDIVSDTPNGQGGTDTTAPAISSVASSSITATQATITWTTDELSDSLVGYSTTQGVFTSETQVSTMTTSHSVVLTGLTPNTTYYFQVQSTDPSSNTGTDNDTGDGYSFTTTQGAVITADSVTTTDVKNTTATVEWATDIASDSYVVYSTNSDMSGSTQTGSATLTTSHSVTITGLTQGTKYYYYVKSTDEESNLAVDNNSGDYYYFTTTSDSSAPTITNLTATSVMDTSAVIEWTTDESATTQVEYGTTSGTYATTTTENTNLNINHAVTLESLASDTTYYYRAISKDGSDNETTSDETTFTTLETLSEESEVQEREGDAASEATAEASASSAGGGGIIIIDKTDKIAPEISGIKISDIKPDSATILWTTNENANSFIQYNPANDKDYQTSGIFDSATKHSVTLKKLDSDTKYYYTVLSADGWGNLAKDANHSFVTISKAPEDMTLEEAMEQLETDTPEETTEEENTIEENSGEKEGIFLSAAEQVLDIIEKTASQVSIGVLESTLERQYEAILKISQIIPPPLMSSEPLVVASSNSATISWSTDKDTNSMVAFSSNGSYDSGAENPYLQMAGNSKESATNHSVNIRDLAPDTIYHYQIISKASVGPEAKSKDFIFKTNSEILEIVNYTVQTISHEEVIFKWSTNIDTDATITYVPYRNNLPVIDEAKNKSIEIFSLDHEITIDDFSSGMFYDVELSGKDKKGRVITKEIKAFKTGQDDLPPAIYQVKTDSAISPGDDIKAQTIISWVTNEPATTRVYYDEGLGDDLDNFSFKTALDENYTKKHVVVITKFEPGMVYRFKAESIDYNGNVASSKVFSVLIPRQKESVFQVIMKTMEKTFGWVKDI